MTSSILKDIDGAVYFEYYLQVFGVFEDSHWFIILALSTLVILDRETNRKRKQQKGRNKERERLVQHKEGLDRKTEREREIDSE